MAEQIIIAELQMNTKSLRDSNATLIQDIAKLRAEQKELQKETKNLQNATDEQSKSYVENDAKLKQLNSEYQNNKKVLAESISGVAGLNDLLEKEVTTVGEAEKANKKLSIIRSQITNETQEGRDAITEINAKLDANNEFIKINSDELKKQKQNVGNYKESIKEAFQELNIFNGGFLGFIQRSQEAGGVGPLLKNSFNSIATGINGATKAAWGFVANPIGAIIAAIAITLGILYGVFKSFTPVVDKAEQAMAAIGAVFNVVKNSIIALVTGTKSLTEVFSGLGDSMADAAEQAANLKKAQQDLEDQQDVLEVQNARATRQINEHLLKSKDRTLSEQERIKHLQEAQKIEKDIYNEKEKLANEELRQAQEKLIIGTGLTNEEVRLLKEKGVEYAKVLQDKYALDDADIDNLKDALIKKENILNDSISIQEKAQNKVNALYEKADEEREKAIERAKKAQEEAIAKMKERQDKEIQMMNDDLSLFIATENLKKKSTLESVDFILKVSQKRIEILEKEYAYGKLSKQKYEEELIKISEDSSNQQALRFIERRKAELDYYVETNLSKIDSTKALTESIINEENKRLESILQKRLIILEAEKETNQQLIDAKIASNQELTNADLEYLTAKKILEDEFKNKKKEQELALEEELKTKQAIDLDNELAQIQLTYDQRLALQLQQLDLQRQAELLHAEKTQADKGKILKKYSDAELALRKNVENQKLDVISNALRGAQALFGEHTAVFKSIAIAQATIDTYKSAVSAYAAGLSVGGPAGLVLAPVSAGIAVASGIANIAKIAGVKFEKGGLQEIGGNLHSAGGTKFVGEDGTTFEAEQGELIGVMNRNAARVFMEFNNAYPSNVTTTRPNVFASGGFINPTTTTSNVNLDIDYDLLASKIGQANSNLPNPVVDVKNIISEQNSYVSVINGANHG